jgi:hypothetical protein
VQSGVVHRRVRAGDVLRGREGWPLRSTGHFLSWPAWTAELTTRYGRAKQQIASLFSEKPGRKIHHPVYGFLHFWVFVGRSFLRNRGPVRATALAYTTLLALVPLLAVSLGVSTSLLKSDEDQTRQLIEQLIGQVAPQLGQLPGTEVEQAEAKQQVIEQIQEFIANIHSGALGVTGTVALVVIAIGLLSTIEAAFNDIWGVLRGRSWMSRVIHYWTTITLGAVGGDRGDGHGGERAFSQCEPGCWRGVDGGRGAVCGVESVVWLAVSADAEHEGEVEGGDGGGSGGGVALDIEQQVQRGVRVAGGERPAAFTGRWGVSGVSDRDLCFVDHPAVWSAGRLRVSASACLCAGEAQ